MKNSSLKQLLLDFYYKCIYFQYRGITVCSTKYSTVEMCLIQLRLRKTTTTMLQYFIKHTHEIDAIQCMSYLNRSSCSVCKDSVQSRW